jgi:hypothetical protein
MMTVCSFPARHIRSALRRHWLLLGSLMLPAAAQAAPFCIESQGLKPYCIYYDAGSCQQEANRQGAICSANPDEVHLTPNVGQYCLVTSQLVSLCIYSDRGTCTVDAQRQNGSCTDAPIVAPSAAPDPFAAIGGR